MFFILFLLFYFLTDSETETSMPERGGNARAEGNQEGSVTGETPWIGRCNAMLNSHWPLVGKMETLGSGGDYGKLKTVCPTGPFASTHSSMFPVWLDHWYFFPFNTVIILFFMFGILICQEFIFVSDVIQEFNLISPPNVSHLFQHHLFNSLSFLPLLEMQNWFSYVEVISAYFIFSFFFFVVEV